jgi:hypothetical protein
MTGTSSMVFGAVTATLRSLRSPTGALPLPADNK